MATYTKPTRLSRCSKARRKAGIGSGGFGSLNLYDAVGLSGELRHHGGIVAGDDQSRGGGQLLHAVLRTEVRIGIQGRGDGHVLFEILIEVHVVAGEDDDARSSIHGDELRGIGVLASD